MLCADVVKDYVQTVMLPGDAPLESYDSGLEKLSERGLADILTEGMPSERITLERLLDVRYLGQSYELTIPYSLHFHETFQQAHLREYGFYRPEAPIQVVNLRLRAIGRIDPPQIPQRDYTGQHPEEASYLNIRQVVFPSGSMPAQFFLAESLLPGNQIQGPAVIVRQDTTIFLSPADRAEVDGFLNIWITVGG
jgi:N-methylhydantoinase A